MSEELSGYLEKTRAAFDRIEEMLDLLYKTPSDRHALTALQHEFQSTKTISSSFDFQITEAICHASEDVLSYITHYGLEIRKETIRLLREALHHLRQLHQSIRDNHHEDKTGTAKLLVRLSSLEMHGSEETKIVQPGQSSESVSELYQLVYMSTSKWKFDTNELIQLLCQARDRNRLENLTGMLIYRDQFFMQTLEGDKENVLACLERVKQDDRHYNVVILEQGAIEERTFPNWSMGFQQMNGMKQEESQTGLGMIMWPKHLREGTSFAYKVMRSFSENIEIG